MKTKYIIVGLIIVLLILFFFQKKEHAGSTPSTSPQLSNEAIQNIAKIYSDSSNTATFNNITTTGTIRGNLTGNVTGNVTGDVTGSLLGDLSNDKIKLIVRDSKLYLINKSTNKEILIGNANNFKPEQNGACRTDNNGYPKWESITLNNKEECETACFNDIKCEGYAYNASSTDRNCQLFNTTTANQAASTGYSVNSPLTKGDNSANWKCSIRYN